MPPHHHHGPNYGDMWWADLPEKARRAANVLGYTANSWDDDAEVPYDGKNFVDCSYEEKNAAMYLKLSPIHKKLDHLWWGDVDDETKKHAAVLGWTEQLWDDDWAIEDLPCEHWWWKDMTPEQQQAGRHFGYGPGTWDYVDHPQEDFGSAAGVTSQFANMNVGSTPAAAPPAATPAAATPAAPMQASQAPAPAAAPATTSSTPASNATAATQNGAKPFMMSKSFGGDGGTEFDHQNHRLVQEITIYSDRHVIHGIKIQYNAHTKLAGKEKGGDHTFVLTAGEYIVGAKIRAGKFVQALSFSTNKGNTLGPVGGRGWLIGGKDKQGQDFEATAPPGGYCMCGIKGKASDDAIDSIMFRWGPVNITN